MKKDFIMTDKVKENYSPELTAKVLELYAANPDIKALALEIGKSERSVRGKLVALKAYKVPVKALKTLADEGPSKKDLTKVLEDMGFSATGLKGLEGATKAALAEVIERTKAVA
jgi:predicted xylose isomerase-like sugar epimerase